MSVAEIPLETTEPPKTELKIEPGDLIAGKYRVEAQIGSGGMGIVVSARHVAMGHRVAIKILKLHEERDPHGAVLRFVREARAAARIQSDHVVRVLDVAALPDGTPYMVMELLEGGDLRALLEERGPLPVEEAVGYALQACEGLAEAHASGVIHRDLKPSNLFLTKKSNGTEVLKLLDFGISKVLPRAGEAGITTTGALMGSPLYMAPEQMRSSKMVDQRADVWSIGCILYELLSGRSPFEGDSIPEVCLSVMGADPLPIAKFRAGIPRDLEAVLVRCMQKTRESRFESMGVLARALEPVASPLSRVHPARANVAARPVRDAVPGDGDVAARPVPRTAFASRPEAETGAAPRAEHDSLRSWSAGKLRPRRFKTAWIALGGAIAVGGLMIGAVVTRTSEPPPDPGGKSTAVAPTGARPATVDSSAPPVATADVPSVPVDSLPLATHDAASMRPVTPVASGGRAKAPPSPPVASPRPAVPAQSPRPASSAGKDGWKWGDRN